LAVACGAAVVAAGCVGTTDRDDFTAIVQERGGGLTSDLPLDAVAAVGDELGVDDFEVRSLSVTPLDATVVLEVRDPDVPANLDRYVVWRGAVDGVEPIRLSAGDDLDAETFPVSGLALDETDAMVDAALAGFDDPGGYVTSLGAARDGGDVAIGLALESPRASATALFTADGALVEVARR
jgi:hypothetical protein